MKFSGMVPQIRMHGWRPPGLRTAFCFGQSTKLSEFGGTGFSPKVIWAWSRRKQRSVNFGLSRPMTCVGRVPVAVIKRVVSWNKSSFYWDTSPCKRPSDTSDANSGSATR